MVPRSTSAATNSKPSVAAARGIGARPATPSQNGPTRSVITVSSCHSPPGGYRHAGAIVVTQQQLWQQTFGAEGTEVSVAYLAKPEVARQYPELLRDVNTAQ